MSCPFLDPEMLARMPAEKREEMREIYERMKQGEKNHLKVGIKDEDIDNMSPENMMMGMTGASVSTATFTSAANNSTTSASPSSAYPTSCPMSQVDSSGGSDEQPNMMNFQEQFEDDP